MSDDDDNSLAEDVAVLKDRRKSQDKVNQIFFDKIENMDKKLDRVVMAMEKQKSFLGGISFSFGIIGTCVGAIVDYFINGGHHSGG